MDYYLIFNCYYLPAGLINRVTVTRKARFLFSLFMNRYISIYYYLILLLKTAHGYTL